MAVMMSSRRPVKDGGNIHRAIALGLVRELRRSDIDAAFRAGKTNEGRDWQVRVSFRSDLRTHRFTMAIRPDGVQMQVSGERCVLLEYEDPGLVEQVVTVVREEVAEIRRLFRSSDDV
jgi:hypothetical protein